MIKRGKNVIIYFIYLFIALILHLDLSDLVMLGVHYTITEYKENEQFAFISQLLKMQVVVFFSY